MSPYLDCLLALLTAGLGVAGIAFLVKWGGFFQIKRD